MRTLSLDFFNLPKDRNYHIHRIDSSLVAEEPHCHDFFQLCFVECGHIQHYLDDAPVLLSAGDAFLVPPGCAHRIVFPEKNVYLYSLSFDEDLFHPGFSQSSVSRFLTALKLDALDRIPVRSKVSLDVARRQTVLSLMEALVREQENTCPKELTAAGSLVSSVVCIMSQGYFLADDTRLQRVDRYSRTMESCIAYIDSHFTAPLTLEEICREFGLSRSAFSMLFPQYAGTTLKRYITKKRIDYAMMLLHSTELSVQQVAAMAGYEDISTFYRNFTKLTGAAPSAYRVPE